LNQPVQLTSSLDGAALERSIAALVDTAAAANRASLRSAELTLRARENAVSVARADYYPTLALSLQAGYQAFPPLGFGFPSKLGTVGESFCPDPQPGRVCQNGGWFSDRSLVASGSWAIFDGFRTQSNVNVARAQVRVAEAELSQEREAVALDVARAQSELTRARAVYETRRQNVAEATEAFNLASLRFSTGLTTQLEVSDAQLSMLNAQSGAIRSVYDLYLAAADLARALGQPVPTPPLAAGSDSKD
jgi:outer membrane protein TolC